MSDRSESAPLGRGDREALLRLARESIAARLERRPSIPASGSDALTRPAGAFVTLTIDGELRGCIGTLDASNPLERSVADAAVSAATRDPRFPPVSTVELERVRLEISVLGDFVPVADPGEIVIGRDGLLIRAGGRSGLLLPQVAVDYGWDVPTFLDRLCVKAGLSPGSWRRPDCHLERFTAEVFGEE
ncbi:MAG: AmmeMemoRadiSam system protein A [Thermoanaerobaculia bacterium]|jgi:AmmeMemoRadiSam system protein A